MATLKVCLGFVTQRIQHIKLERTAASVDMIWIPSIDILWFKLSTQSTCQAKANSREKTNPPCYICRGLALLHLWAANET